MVFVFEYKRELNKYFKNIFLFNICLDDKSKAKFPLFHFIKLKYHIQETILLCRMHCSTISLNNKSEVIIPLFFFIKLINDKENKGGILT